jgi:hypothetical protein
MLPLPSEQLAPTVPSTGGGVADGLVVGGVEPAGDLSPPHERKKNPIRPAATTADEGKRLEYTFILDLFVSSYVSIRRP